MKMNFNETQEFLKDFKRLSKKYKSLPGDLLEFKKIVSEFPLGSGKHFIILQSLEDLQIVKARFFCRYLKGQSLRIIYAYQESLNFIYFLEIYFTGEQENENRDLIHDFIRSLNKK